MPDTETTLQMTLITPASDSYRTDPDAIKAEAQEYLSKWWLAQMPGVVVRVDGVSAREVSGE